MIICGTIVDFFSKNRLTLFVSGCIGYGTWIGEALIFALITTFDLASAVSWSTLIQFKPWPLSLPHGIWTWPLFSRSELPLSKINLLFELTLWQSSILCWMLPISPSPSSSLPLHSIAHSPSAHRSSLAPYFPFLLHFTRFSCDLILVFI